MADPSHASMNLRGDSRPERLRRASHLVAAMVAVVALVVVALTPGIVSARTVTGPDGCGTLVPTLKGWEVPTPRYPDGSQSTSTYAVDPWRSKTLLVTNSSIVMKSSDGGCSWRTVFSLSKEMADGPLPVGGDGSIESIITAGRPSASYYLVVNGGFDTGSLGQPHIYRSRDGGSSWQLADDGLPIEATASHLVFAPSDPDTGYLVIGHGAAGLGGISFYYTHDGGDSWEAATEPTETLPTSDQMEARASLRDLAVSPTDPRELWVTTTERVYSSGDGGRNWQQLDLYRGQLGPILITPEGPSSSTIRIFSSTAGDNISYVSSNGGRSWSVLRTPGPLDSVVDGVRPGELFGAFNIDGTGVFIYDDGGWVVVTDFGGASYSNLQRDFTSEPRVYLSSGNSLWVYQPVDLQAARQIGQRFPNKWNFACDAQPEIADGRNDPIPPRLDPDVVHLSLSPGERATVSYRLSLQDLAKLDIYFLMDTTTSMGGVICGLGAGTADIVRGLAQRELNAEFGIGSYEDYGSRYAYVRHREIGPADGSFVQALQELSPSGGGSEAEEAGQTALYQSATGEGADVPPPGPSNGDTPPGWEAGFRSDSARTIVMMTDSHFKYWPGYTPTWLEMIQALQDEHIKVVGIVPNNLGITNPVAAEQTLKLVALQTGAIATEPGVDCDGDHSIDIPPGQPLVCVLQPESDVMPIADPILNLLGGLKGTLVDVGLKELTQTGWVTNITPPTFTADLLTKSTFKFDVTYTCDLGSGTTQREVRLGGQVAGSVVAQASALITCSDLPVTTKGHDAAGITLPLAPAQGLLPEFNPGPQPNPGNQPNPAQQQQAQQQTQANAQAAAVAQRQEQPQMAFVHAAQQLKEQTAGQHAALRTVQQRSDPLASVKFGLAMSAISMLLIYGLATATVRTRLARNHRG